MPESEEGEKSGRDALFPDSIDEDKEQGLDAKIQYEFVGKKGFHSGAITCMDISV